MNNKQLYCENCNKKYKNIDTSNFIQIIKSHIQNSFRMAVDQEQIKKETFVNQTELFKCPNCGFCMRAINNEQK